MNEFLTEFSLNAEGAAEAIEATEEITAGTLEPEPDMSIKFHPEQFLPNLKYMGIGMLCIFIVMGVIILSVVALNKLTGKKKK